MFLLANEVQHKYVFEKKDSEKYVLISLRQTLETLGRLKVKNGIEKAIVSKEEEKMFLDFLDVYFGLRIANRDGLANDVPVDFFNPYGFYVIKK